MVNSNYASHRFRTLCLDAAVTNVGDEKVSNRVDANAARTKELALGLGPLKVVVADDFAEAALQIGQVDNVATLKNKNCKNQS